jgi:hypothetical protein
MTIINLNGTHPGACQCGNWLRHWQNFSVLPMPLHCPGLLCRERAEVAVLVQRSDVQDPNWYVVPLCKSHSQSKVSLEISSFTQLVSANVTGTCDRS